LGDGNTTYAVNVIKSLRWPGSVTVAKGGKFCSIYVGDGCKRGDSCFNPTKPDDVSFVRHVFDGRKNKGTN